MPSTLPVPQLLLHLGQFPLCSFLPSVAGLASWAYTVLIVNDPRENSFRLFYEISSEFQGWIDQDTISP